MPIISHFGTMLPFLVQMKIEDNKGQKGINLIVILEIPIISKAKIATTKLG